MIDEKKVRLMTRMASYESGKGREDLKISAYYRKDYAGIYMVSSILWVTLGYGCLLVLIGICMFNQILESVSMSMVMTLGAGIVAGYLAAERADGLLGLLYPHVCPFCGKVTAEPACRACRGKVRVIGEPSCMRCGKPVRREEDEYCYDCGRRGHEYERGHALWLHAGGAMRAIYQFKYHNRRIYSRFFAQELFSRYQREVRAWEIGVIIPIPLSRKRRRQRGYNQAELLAKELGKKFQIPVDARRLVRARDTRPQKQMDMRGRRDNLKNAFAWKGRERIHGNVLLVDDIYTTGNTIDAAARVLKRNGARKVYFLSISIGQGY